MYRTTTAGKPGFTLVEIAVAIGIFILVGTISYDFVRAVLRGTQNSRARIASTEMLQQQVEIVRNLPYDDVGEVGGIPDGKLPHSKTVTSGGFTYDVTTTVRNVDDPTDGTIGGSPNDLSPADYRKVEIRVACTAGCGEMAPLVMTTTQAPKSLETASTNGALFMHVLDSAGLPVAGAAVHIVNAQTNPDIVIDDVTDNDGWLKIIDAPPGTDAYEITVSKSGYSTARTYAVNDPPGNANPLLKHATVIIQQVTQITLSIDQTGLVNVTTSAANCAAVGGVTFSLDGAKLIGTVPDVHKYSDSFITDGATGLVSVPDLEWDAYTVTQTNGSYDLRGMMSPNPFTLAPGGTQDVRIVLSPKSSKALLVTVIDAATQLPITGASALLTKSGYSTTLVTGSGYQGQTEWSGGSGQEDMTDDTKYAEDDGHVYTASPTGQLGLSQSFGAYDPAGTLTSSTFDSGLESVYQDITWLPATQAPETGTDSVRFQVATSPEQEPETWDFVGPDGTSSTYFTPAATTINAAANGNQYMRFKAFLTTADPAFTPIVSDVNYTFTSSCVPPGQVLFTALGSGTYALEIQKSGYQTYDNAAVSVSADWSEIIVTLYPS